jgi:penicillin-binding protein 1A
MFFSPIPKEMGFRFSMKKHLSYIYVSLSLLLSIYIIYLIITLPNVSKLENYTPNESSKIYSKDGILLTEFYKEENRNVVRFDEISKNIINAVIANEDVDFYYHHGISIKGLVRALVADIATVGFSQGGSTITQQVAKNVFLTQKKTINRKIKEIILAILIDARFSKTKILEVYLNQIYFANNLYGIESASQFYFNKKASELWLSEASLLAGIIKAPEYYNPITQFDRAKKQQKIVLDRMVKLGMISQYDARLSYTRRLIFSSKTRPIKAPYFISYVFNQLHDLYGEDLFFNGYKVYTTMNYRMQSTTEGVVQGWKRNSLDFSQIAVLGVSVNGGIEVMQGGINFYQSQLNRCYQTKRQIGSVFKPIVYLTAIENGYSPYAFVDDSPIYFDSYIPKNYGDKEYGVMTLEEALAFSNNIATIKVMQEVGIEKVMQNAILCGISDVQPIIPLALGVSESTLIKLVNMYNIFANSGVENEIYGIERIEDKNGKIIYQHKSEGKQIFLDEDTKQLVGMLKNVVNFGTGRNASLGFNVVAGKTGTTSDYRDAWFLGFTDKATYGVWCGNDNNTPMNDVTGGLVPAKIWKNIMQYNR